MAIPAYSTSACEFRAYLMFTELPNGCIAFPVTDGLSEPHLRAGEFAIVDTADTDLVNGEAYVIEWENGRRSLCQARNRGGRWVTSAIGMVWPRAGRGADPETVMGNANRFGLVDGPYCDPEHLRSKLVGRVIGILEPAEMAA